MCGISGIIDFGTSETRYSLPAMLHKMTNSLAHRGPDDEGYLLFYPDGGETVAYGDATHASLKGKGVHIGSANTQAMAGLGHRRLAIIDSRPAGHQPMTSADGRFTIVYNGEVYNFQDLRLQLIKHGYTFTTDTDTEVLLACYAHWGDFMTKYLEGMWAFVIYDREKKILFGSRDRFGVKPLYYTITNHYFAFASEAKALVGLPFIDAKVFRPAAFEYLVNGKLEYESQSLFVDVNEVASATSFHFRLEEKVYKSWTHYNLGYKPDLGSFDAEKFKHHSHKVRKSVTTAIKDRLVGDAPVGVFLSGGVDSSAIACLLNKVIKETPNANVGSQIKAFTAGYDDRKLDESRYAKRVVEQIGADWHRIVPKGDQFIHRLEEMAYAQDFPVLGTGTFSHYLLMEKASKEGIKVVLDGVGGDELFSGYRHHFNIYMRDLWREGAYGQYLANLLAANTSFASRGSLLRARGRQLYFAFAEKYRKSLISQETVWEYQYLRPEFWGRYKKKFDISTLKNLNATMHSEFTDYKLKYMLRNADRNAMHFGVENRVPFVDNHRLVEYLFNLPIAYKIRYAQSKILLRSALGNTLPREILFRRDKKGFEGPDARWLMEQKGPLLEYMSHEMRDLYDVKAIQKDWNKIVSRAHSDGTQRIWRLIFFAAWRKAYNV